MGQIPIFLRNDGLLLTLIDWKLGLLYSVHLILGSQLFLCFPPTIGDFSHIGGVVQDGFHKRGREAGNRAVLPEFLCIAVTVEVLCNTGNSVIGMGIAVKKGANDFHFILCNQHFSVFQPVAAGGKSAVPLSLTSLLLSDSHGLRPNILLFNFRHSRESRNYQLVGVLGAVNAILTQIKLTPKSYIICNEFSTSAGFLNHYFSIDKSCPIG